MGEAKRKHNMGYFRGDLDPPLTFWRAIWKCSRDAALKNHPYYYILPRREQSNFLLRQLHHTCRVMGTPPMRELMLYIHRNPNTGYNEFMLVQSIADPEVESLLVTINSAFPGDDYPVSRLDPDHIEPAYTVRIPPLPTEAMT
jgi:hypothetical protein